jgi:hypothetical protein
MDAYARVSPNCIAGRETNRKSGVAQAGKSSSTARLNRRANMNR